MEHRKITSYLRALENDLWQRGISDPDTLAEVEDHLLEAIEQGQARGLSPVQAEDEALERFGSAKLIGSTLEKERTTPMQKFLLAFGILAGLSIAYVDSRPTWDDAGITAVTLLVVSGLLTLLGHRRPWLIALAVGLWTPLYETYASQNLSLPGMLLLPAVILLICQAGAYAGWAVHQVLRRTLRPA